MSIYEKLSNIQDELFVPKGNRNDFGKYNYRSCEDILKTVKPLCKAQKCVLYITNSLKSSGERVYIEAEAHLKDLESDEEIICTAQAREEESKKGMDGSQITGSSSSYARKYALAGLFCIDNEKDSDATNHHNTISKKEAELLKNLWIEKGGTEENLLTHCHASKLTDITDEIYASVMRQLEAKDGK